MPWGIAAVAAAGAYSTYQKNKASQKANEATQEGISGARDAVSDAATKGSSYLDPVSASGDAARTRLTNASGTLYGAGNEGIQTLQGQKGALNVGQFLDPSAAYSMKQANDALEASAAARGGLLSGATLKNLNEQSSKMAQQNYNQAAQLALANRNQQIGVGNSLVDVGKAGLANDTNLAQMGTQGRFNQAQLQTNLGQDLATLEQSAGNSNAANAGNQRSVLGSAVTSGINAYFSDERLKHDIDKISDSEIDEFLSAMEPKSYVYDDEALEKGASRGKQVGVMAQDAKKSKVGKTIVTEDVDGDMVVDIPKTVSALLATAASLNSRLKKVEGKK